MAVFEGVYKSLIQGVSQQTPQEREDGQLGEQINMLSDPVTGLRRRGGIKYHASLDVSPKCYFKIIIIKGDAYIVAVDTQVGKVSVMNFNTKLVGTINNDYLIASSKRSIRTTVSQDKLFIVNTDKVPTKEVTGVSTRLTSYGKGYFSIRGSAFSKKFFVTLDHPKIGRKSYDVTTSDNAAASASPEWVALELQKKIVADIDAIADVHVNGNTVEIIIHDHMNTLLTVTSPSTAGGYMLVSETARVPSRTELLGRLYVLNDFTMAVGNTGNSAYYRYSLETGRWSETSKYEPPYKIKDEPQVLLIEDNTMKLEPMGIKQRSAGDDDNNPEPQFLGFGITGIGSYQSRLVLLSGAYIYLSKTNTYNEFMRTSVTEVLDDDAIEISSASLTSAQFEYCIPYNKDLVLVSQNQQAVMPANNTVLTPRSAVIYPSTSLDLSLAVEPRPVGRTMYYAYQRGVEYYQVGEFIPNTYTDAQYYSQNLTDHIPLYAHGICTAMSSSSTNNMVVFGSDSEEVLINQYMWVGEERSQMAFYKWKYPYRVMHTDFINEYLISIMDDGVGGVYIGTQNVQLNQLDDKPIPYLDMYTYITIKNGVGDLPSMYIGLDFKAVIYDDRNRRHKDVAYTVDATTSQIHCPYNGVIAVGLPFESLFTLTPPFIRDDAGRVIAGTRTTIQQLRMTFKSTGTFQVTVKDTMGTAYDIEGNTAYTWSEADLGYSWVNSIGAVVIPCRTRLSSTDCTVKTDGATDMNLVSTEYVLRLASKRKRL